MKQRMTTSGLRFRRMGWIAIAAAATATPLALASPVSALGAPQATAGTNSVTVPLFGVPLTLDLTTDATGTLTNVAVNPADSFTATDLRPNRVEFQNTAGTAEIVVRNKEGRQSLTVRAGALADISGAGRWSGDVFGTGTATTVDYVVGATAEGAPTITDVVSSDPTAQIGALETSQDATEQEAKVQVQFTSGSQRRTLSIKAELETETEEGITQTEASLKITLGRLRALAVPAADIAGPKTWSGTLCNGTAASINYTLNLDGTITGVTATPAPESIRGGEHHVDVRFLKWQRVRLHSVLTDGLITLEVVERFSCDARPGVNTGVSTTGPRGNGNDDNNGNGNGRDDNGGGNGRDDNGGGNGNDSSGNGRDDRSPERESNDG